MRQALVLGAEVVAEGVVAAGVEDDQIERVAGAGQAVEQQADIDALRLDVGFFLDLGIDRYEEVAPVQLQAVAGVVENADAAAGLQLLREVADALLHFGAAAVEFHRHRKSGLTQPLGDGWRIVGGVDQRPDAVLAVADHQRVARRPAEVGIGSIRQRGRRQQAGDRQRADSTAPGRGRLPV